MHTSWQALKREKSQISKNSSNKDEKHEVIAKFFKMNVISVCTEVYSTFSDPIELKKFDFSQNPMRMPLISFWGLKTAKKGVSIAFLLSAVTISES